MDTRIDDFLSIIGPRHHQEHDVVCGAPCWSYRGRTKTTTEPGAGAAGSHEAGLCGEPEGSASCRYGSIYLELEVCHGNDRALPVAEPAKVKGSVNEHFSKDARRRCRSGGGRGDR